MSSASETEKTGPTAPSDRIVGLDALRGFALLGILLINVWVFSMPETTLSNPTIYGDFTGGNYWAWFVGHVFAQQKFITIFTILFGGGVVLFTRNVERRDGPVFELYVRRSGWLVAFGLAHAYLLWYGDILVAYGVCAFVVVLFRDHDPRTLAIAGVALLSVPSLIEVIAAVTAEPATVASSWQPAESALRAEVETYRSGWLTQMEHRVPAALRRQTTGLLGYTGWRVSGSMLLGMALFKWGVLTNERSAQFYRRLVAIGGAIGLAAVLAGVRYIQANDWSVEAALFWRQFNYWGSVPLALAYVGIVMLYCKRRPDGVVTRSLAAVGRTAFSNYILQTVLATSIFYGHGLGLFGRMSRLELYGIVVVIWAVQVPLSVLWLRYFRYGPLEWIWRVLTYESMQPLRAAGADEADE
ncbi:hypothetical protein CHINAEXTREME_03835 [Halobiforma lacisalsi AJ5]|uniref:DUF418 domain-containing protein n=1 Tax=Natronobacterium lacisalsi AJ5 TaxID=358396 RepID=M0LNH1_NATLA|nr:DUF418 domain-containing protein [Halobiforma lacisalsi]APW96952.1 hypothetical protein CHINAEXTREME_03835 [Halobiforma lacisalsi AJ5]EMA34663.1 hypothetical protein C445_07075 [Halobiforma lacisalsi AJ5]